LTQVIDFGAVEDKKLQDVVKFLTYRCGKSGKLNRTRVMKLIYLAELRSIEKSGKRLTDCIFKNWNYGPFSSEILSAIENIGTDVKREAMVAKEGRKGEFLIPIKEKTFVNLEKDEMTLLDEVLSTWKYESNENIISSSKKSPPFTWTSRGDTIPFEEYTEFIRNVNLAKHDRFRNNCIVLSSDEDIDGYLSKL